MIKQRGIVIRAVNNIEKAEDENNLTEARKWLKFAVKADLSYNKMWNEEQYIVEELILERASQYETKGNIKRAEQWFKRAEEVNDLYKELGAK